MLKVPREIAPDVAQFVVRAKLKPRASRTAIRELLDDMVQAEPSSYRAPAAVAAACCEIVKTVTAVGDIPVLTALAKNVIEAHYDLMVDAGIRVRGDVVAAQTESVAQLWTDTWHKQNAMPPRRDKAWRKALAEYPSREDWLKIAGSYALSVFIASGHHTVTERTRLMTYAQVVEIMATCRDPYSPTITIPQLMRALSETRGQLAFFSNCEPFRKSDRDLLAGLIEIQDGLVNALLLSIHARVPVENHP